MNHNDRRYLILACFVAIALIYVVPLFLPTPLLDPDEGIHAVISQEMVETGDYVVPRFLGRPFLDKPALYFWTQAVALKCVGMNEVGVRLPGLLFALLGTWTTFLVARDLFGRQAALIAAMASLTLFVPAILAQAATHDIAQVPWTNLMLLFLLRASNAEGWRRNRFVLAAGLFVGLALVTKGLIGIAVASVGYWLFGLVDRRISLAMIGRYLAALFCGVIVASPWYVAMEMESPGYLFYYFVQRHVMGFATTTQLHASAPWYYYLPIVVLGSFPWLIPAGIEACRSFASVPDHNDRERKNLRFVSCWFVGGLLFLSAASSKLITYSLPLFPPIAILAGFACQRFLDGRMSRSSDKWVLRTLTVSAVFGIVSPFAAFVVLSRVLQISTTTLTWCAAAMIASISVMGLCAVIRRRRSTALATIPVWSALMIAAILLGPLQQVSERYSQRSLALRLRVLDPFPQRISFSGERLGSLVFYLRPSQRKQIRASIQQLPLQEVENRPHQLADTLVIVAGHRSTQELPGLPIPIRIGRFDVYSPTSHPAVARRAQSLGR